MRCIDQMLLVDKQLQAMGYQALYPDPTEPTNYQEIHHDLRDTHKSKLITKHIEKIKKSSAVLIVNETFGHQHNYIGANSFLEMGFAYLLGIPIYLYNDIPDQPNTDEIRGMLPIVIHRNLQNIKL